MDVSALLGNPAALLAAAGGSWLLLFALAILRPQRLFNCVLLLAALMISFYALVVLLCGDAGTALAICALAATALLLLIPLMLIWNGIMMLKKEAHSLHTILSLLIGLVIALAETALGAVLFSGFAQNAPALPTALVFFASTVFYGSALMLGFILYVFFMQFLPHFRRFDTIVVHGCALLDGSRVSKILSNRLDKALELYHRSKDRALIVVSGGQGDDETIPEAEAMRRYLLDKGVPEERILPERFSRSTEENLRFSRQLLDERGDGGRIALVTSNYHVYRCNLLARELGMRCVGIGAKVAWYYWPSAVIREFAAVFLRKRNLILSLIGYTVCVLLPLGLIFAGR